MPSKVAVARRLDKMAFAFMGLGEPSCLEERIRLTLFSKRLNQIAVILKKVSSAANLLVAIQC